MTSLFTPADPASTAAHGAMVRAPGAIGLSAGVHNDPHFTDLAAMGLKPGRGENAFGILRQSPKPITEPAPKRVYIQMTKTQKAASAFMSREERKAWRQELAAVKK